MNQKRNIIIIIVAAAMLVGLVFLAKGLDAGNKNPGTTSTGGQTQGTTESTEGGKDKWSVTYEEYNAMSSAEQEAFYYSFDSADDYFQWYKAAKKVYEDNKNDIVIGGDGSIDLGEILNKK